MDLSAIAETAVEMWCLVGAKLIGRRQENIEPEIKAQVFSEAMKLYMTQIINEKKYGAPDAPTEERAERPTEKQIQYAKDLGCDKPEDMTKQQLSKWIDEHR